MSFSVGYIGSMALATSTFLLDIFQARHETEPIEWNKFSDYEIVVLKSIGTTSNFPSSRFSNIFPPTPPEWNPEWLKLKKFH